MRLLLRWWMSLIVAVAGAVAATATSSAGSVPAVSLDGTLLRATLADGASVAGRQLVGRQLLIPAGDRQLALRIDAVHEDAAVPGLFLYEMQVQSSAGEWNNICEPDRHGHRWAIPLSGHVSADGQFEPEAGRLTLTCTSGVQGKCLRAGYHFWKPGSDIDRKLLEHFQACTRLYRADYCGDGRGWTSDGTLIDVYDDAGVQAPEPHSTLAFEAGWSPRGAVCVHHTRVPENIRLGKLLERCPRLAKAPSGRLCNEERARREGAILFNKSRARP